jgi:hypothetical protein
MGRVAEFRIDIEIIGNTMLFTRWEENSEEDIPGFHGFGHEFEKRFTSFQSNLTNSTGHHRVIEYKLGSMQTLLRFEVDGFAKSATPSTSVSPNIDNLTSMLATTTLETEISKVPASTGDANFTVLHGGFNVSHQSLIELKTRSLHRPLQVNEVIYQLWFGQVRHLKVGYHYRQQFTRVDEKNFQANGEFADFEKQKKIKLKELIVVLERIRKKVKEMKGKRAILLHQTSGQLVIYSREGEKRVLPSDLLEKWE